MTLLPSAHVDGWSRAQLPPLQAWPVMHHNPPYDYPATLNAAERLVDDAVREGHGDRIALVSLDTAGGASAWRETSYRTLQQRIDALAHVLVQELGVVSGNRVLLRGANSEWMAVAWLAVLKVGAVSVTTMPLLRAVELRTVIDRAQCTVALCDARALDELHTAAQLAETPCAVHAFGSDAADALDVRVRAYTAPFPAVATSADDVCLIAFTSGSTGIPKGCMHFHRDVMAMCDGFSAQVLGLGASDRTIGTPPFAFTFGLGGLLCFPLASRGTAVLIERATPETLLDAIEATRATVSFTAPTFYRQMALTMQREPQRWRLSALRASVSAGEALPDATRTLWRNVTGIEMLDGIGATEMIHIFAAAAGADVRPGSIGKAVPGYELAIVGDDLRPLPPDTIGRLAVRGPTGCRYLNDPRQHDYVQNGWNLTGDAATMDSDGYLYFRARTDDIILSAGYNIGAPEVEAAVLQHPSVSECAVVGVPDEDRGHVVKAYVVLKPEIAATLELVHDLQDFVKQTIAPYKYPRLVEFVQALPKTDTGKLQRFRLKHST